MLNFTIGPVASPECVSKIGAEDCPYFRTAEFSEMMLESERLILDFIHAPIGSRAVFLTSSGTGGMEAAVSCLLTERDKAIVVNGGTFGQRFCDLCGIFGVNFTPLNLQFGRSFSREQLECFPSGYTAFLVNAHETSSCVLYDMELVSEYCRKNDMFLIVDAISSFMADDFDMERFCADAVIIGSQKALACHPGVSIVVLSPRAISRAIESRKRSMYFDLAAALHNQDRGQTQFTPAVGVLRQIHARLLDVESRGGVRAEVNRIGALARDFRLRIMGLPLLVASDRLSNAATSCAPTSNQSAYDIFLKMQNEFGIWICPNGGDMKNKVFRVGHIGSISIQDNEILVNALKEVLN